MASMAAANRCVLAAFQNGDVFRWYTDENELSPIDFGRDRCSDIGRVLLEPKGFHAIVTNTASDSWYLNFMNDQARALPKLKGHVIECVSWDAASTENSTRDLLVGTVGGQILHVVIEGKERTVRPLFVFDLGSPGEQRRIPVCGVHRERIVSVVDGSERTVILAAAGCGIYAFVGSSLETIFQRYQGDSATSRALVYEVPRDSPHGDLQVHPACVGPPSKKIVFWLTGVGVLAAEIQTRCESDSAAVLEQPPGLIPFPQSPKSMVSGRSGGSLIASFLPPPPAPSPLSMAVTAFHIIFLFDDRWAALSRISHEVVQQQEWVSATYGMPRILARDESRDDVVWLCSDKLILELIAEREDRHVWTSLLEKEQFDDACAACHNNFQRARVVAAHANFLFRSGEFVQAAEKFAAAVDVPFEHVVLRFLNVDKKAALLEYLHCRLGKCPAGEKVVRALLGVLTVEVSLAHLNDLKQDVQDGKKKAASELDSQRKRLHELLIRDCKNLDVHATIYHLLQSHGWLEELASFAEARKDYTTVIMYHVSRRDCASAIQKLTEFSAVEFSVVELVCRFAPILFGAEPRDFVSLLLTPQLSVIEPFKMLPAIYVPEGAVVHREEAKRYLEQVLRHHPDFMGQGTAAEGEAGGNADDESSGKRGRHPGGSLSLDSGLGNTVGEDDPGEATAVKRSGWASGTAVLNVLTVLYACDCSNSSDSVPESAKPGPDAAAAMPSSGEHEETLLRFLAEHEKSPLLDPHFALRVCWERGLTRTVVLLYGLMGLHEEAVDVALQRGDIALAKHNACKPTDKRVRQKLWLRIVKSQASSGDVQRIINLIHESQELSVRDVLPDMSDTMTIDKFQAEICECLDTYRGQINTLRQEMDENRHALQEFKDDLKETEKRPIVIPQDQPCEICGAPAIRERFYVFACTHCFHEACLRALVVPVLTAKQSERLFELEEMRLEYQAAAAGASSAGPSAAMLAEAEDELDGILADDCPLCGRLMIQTLRRPFIDPCEDAEVESWTI